jgi:molybdopterin-guanine dinucleotide biosynthesis protein A
MGGINKAFIEVGGERLIDRTMRIYRALFGEVIISTNSPLEYLEFDARIVTDIYKGKGPLGGIHAGLLHATCEHAFVSACDMPYLSEAFIGHMIAQADGYDLVVPVTANGFESLHAIYSRSCLPVIESQIARDELKVALLFRKFKTREVHGDEIRRFDPEERLFANLNRPDDLDQITRT